MSNKYCWVWEIKERELDKYVKMHQNPWEEILIEHTKAGIKNYSIFQNGTQFIYIFECDNIEKAFKYLNESSACQKWNSITSKMVEGSFDLADKKPIKFLKEIFYLDKKGDR